MLINIICNSKLVQKLKSVFSMEEVAILNKEERTIEEMTVTDTNGTDDPNVTAQEQSIDTQTASETDTATEFSDANSVQGENDDDSQALNALAEINQRLEVLQELFETQSANAQESPPLQSELAQMDQRLAALHALFDNQIARNQNQKQMFDTIYREMKDYKENSLMEAFQKPIIHNLIQFYDNFVEVEAQFGGINRIIESLDSLFDDGCVKQLETLRPKEEAEKLQQTWKALKEKLADFRNNMENVRFKLVEILYRIDVEPYEEKPPKKLDRELHKTIETEPTDDPDQNQNVTKVHRIGFYWGEKVFRPAEVTILRYTPSAEEKGDETDG